MYVPKHRRCTKKRHHVLAHSGEFYMDLFPILECKFCGARP